MSEQPFATGRCLCGAVTYSIKTAPARMAQCHCKDCQRASGTGHMSLAFFPEDDVVIEGDFAEYEMTADSGNTNIRAFCPRCGSRLFGRNSGRPGVRAVAVGTADDNSWFSPNAVIYCERRADWDITSNEVPNFDGMPPPPPQK